MPIKNPPDAQRWKTIVKVFVMQAAMQVDALTRSDLYVLAWLLEYADKEGDAWPGVETLALLTGLNVRTVQRSLEALCEWGLIELVEVGGGREKSNVWRLKRITTSPFAPLRRLAKRGELTRVLSAKKRGELIDKLRSTRPKLRSPRPKNCGEGATRYQRDISRRKDIPSAPTAHPMDAGDAGVKQKLCILDSRLKAGTIPRDEAVAEIERLRDTEAVEEGEIGHAERLLERCEREEQEVLDAFADQAAERLTWQTPVVLNDKRRKAIRRRLDECGLAGVKAMIAARAGSRWLPNRKVTIDEFLSDVEWNILRKEVNALGTSEGAVA